MADVLMENVNVMKDGMVNFAIRNSAIRVAMPMGNVKTERVSVSQVGMANIVHSKDVPEGKDSIMRIDFINMIK